MRRQRDRGSVVATHFLARRPPLRPYLSCQGPLLPASAVTAFLEPHVAAGAAFRSDWRIAPPLIHRHDPHVPSSRPSNRLHEPGDGVGQQDIDGHGNQGWRVLPTLLGPSA